MFEKAICKSLCCLLLVLASISSGSDGNSDKTTKLVSGTFYDYADKFFWDQERWHKEMAWMRELGMDTIILTPTVKESLAFYPTTVTDMKSCGSDPLSYIFDEADKYGMHIHLMIYDTAGYWNASTSEYYDELAAKNKLVVKDLYNQYGHHKSLVGFYIVPEFWYPASDEICEIWVKNYLGPVTSYVKTLNSELKVSCAPFAGITTNVIPDEPKLYEGYRQHWSKILSRIPDLDLIMFQDGIGAAEYVDTMVKGRSYDVIRQLFENNKIVCDAYNKELWCDLEAFQMVGKCYPPHISRIINQLPVCSDYVTKVVTFEFSYLSPSRSVSAVEFFENYKRFASGKPLLENVARAKAYKLSSKPSYCESDANVLLTDGGMESVEREYYLGWEGQKKVEVVVDLGMEFPEITGFAGSFLSHEKLGFSRPSDVQIRVSKDGKKFSYAGKFKTPNAKDDFGQNIYQANLKKPVSGRFVKFIINSYKGRDVYCGELAVYSTVPNLLSDAKKYEFSQKPSLEYPDETFELTDRDFAERWYAQTGWKDLDKDLEIVLDLGKVSDINQIEAYFLKKANCDVNLPQKVTCQLSNDKKSFGDEIELTCPEVKDLQTNCFAGTLNAKARFVKFIIKPSQGWTLTSEIRVYGK